MRTAASICHDDIIDELKKQFEEIKGVKFKKTKGLNLLIVDDKVVLRFKKFNSNLLSSNISTNQAIAYNLQDSVQLELKELPPDGLLHEGIFYK